jgi:phosphoribosyl 1,2-cyclic phosphodiesterase
LEVVYDGHRLVLDAGTGLRALGDKVMSEARRLGRGPQLSFLFTHLHWDHIQGFPFFAPAFRPDAVIDLYGPRGYDDERAEGRGVPLTLEQVLNKQMQPPSFPVPLNAMPSTKRFHTIASGDVRQIGPFTVRARALNHPQGVLGYRIEAGGRSMCFATDTEHEEGKPIDEAILDLAKDVDLLVYDAQYTEAEYAGKDGPSRKGWGHSTYVAAARIAKAAGARQLALFHHDPSHDDAMIEAIESDARTIFNKSFASRERTTVEL